MVVLLVTVDVVLGDLLLTDPALLHRLLVTLAAAGLGVPHEEELTELDPAVFTPAESDTIYRSQREINLKHDLW